MKLKDWVNENPMTTLMYIVFVLVAVVGGALVLFDSAGTLSYEDYLDNLTKFALAIGILGAGKAIKKGLGGYEDGFPPPDDGSGELDDPEAGSEPVPPSVEFRGDAPDVRKG